MSERTTEQLKYLELVQVNIARMHDASTSMKRFALVAFALGGSLARYLQDTTILGLMMVVIAAFWVLDSKYLQVEHGYRSLFEIVRAQPTGDESSFDLTPSPGTAIPLRELWSWSTCVLYGPLILLLAVVWICADWET